LHWYIPLDINIVCCFLKHLGSLLW